MTLLAPSRRVLLRDGSLLTLGLCLGCSTPPPATKADSGGAGDAGGDAGAADTGAPPDVCAAAATPGADGWTAVALDPLPAVGEGVALEISGRAVVLARPDADCVVVVSRACTHQGCDVAFVEGRFVCPCHGAAFRRDGSVLSGPTSVPLTSYPADMVDGAVWVQMP